MIIITKLLQTSLSYKRTVTVACAIKLHQNVNQKSRFRLLTGCSSPHCELCGNPSLQPQQLSVMPAPVSGPCHFSPHCRHQPWKRRGCVCLCEKHTWQRRRPITPPLNQPTSSPPPPTPTQLLFLRPPSHLLPFPPSRAPRAEMDLCLGLGDVTFGNLRFESSEEWTGGTISLCLQCMQTLVYACESWISFCIQVRYGKQFVVYHLLCLQIYRISIV